MSCSSRQISHSLWESDTPDVQCLHLGQRLAMQEPGEGKDHPCPSKEPLPQGVAPKGEGENHPRIPGWMSQTNEPLIYKIKALRKLIHTDIIRQGNGVGQSIQN